MFQKEKPQTCQYFFSQQDVKNVSSHTLCNSLISAHSPFFKPCHRNLFITN